MGGGALDCLEQLFSHNRTGGSTRTPALPRVHSAGHLAQSLNEGNLYMLL